MRVNLIREMCFVFLVLESRSISRSTATLEYTYMDS